MTYNKIKEMRPKAGTMVLEPAASLLTPPAEVEED